MSIRILINGAQGKMGQQTVKALSECMNEMTIVGKLSHNDDLAGEIKKTQAQVVVDFTNAEVVFKKYGNHY